MKILFDERLGSWSKVWGMITPHFSEDGAPCVWFDAPSMNSWTVVPVVVDTHIEIEREGHVDLILRTTPVHVIMIELCADTRPSFDIG